MMAFYSRHKSQFKAILLVMLAILYLAYFGYAMYYQFGDEGSIRLLWVTSLVLILLIMSVMMRHLRPQQQFMSSSKCIGFIREHHRQINWSVAYTPSINAINQSINASLLSGLYKSTARP